MLWPPTWSPVISAEVEVAPLWESYILEASVSEREESSYRTVTVWRPPTILSPSLDDFSWEVAFLYSHGGYVNSGALQFQDTKEVGVNEQPWPTCLSFLGRSSP